MIKVVNGRDSSIDMHGSAPDSIEEDINSVVLEALAEASSCASVVVKATPTCDCFYASTEALPSA